MVARAPLALVACVVLAAAAVTQPPLSSSDEALFEVFVASFDRKYTGTERAERFDVFKRNIASARRLQQSADAHGDPVRFGLTPLMDLTAAEYRAVAFTAPAQLAVPRSNDICNTPCGTSATASFDWRADRRGVVGPVLNQGHCGACWAFVTAEIVQAAWAIANQTAPAGPLSVQQLVSCMSYMCNGGDVHNALAQVKQTGLMADSAFPYKCADGCSGGPPAGNCTFLTPPLAELSQIIDCAPVSESSLACLLRQYGPFGVRVDPTVWQSYVGGILRHNCEGEYPGDHTVLLVGYGADPATAPPTPYWILKNSWGTSFGENGYIRIARGSNLCGIANDVHSAVSPSPV